MTFWRVVCPSLVKTFSSLGIGFLAAECHGGRALVELRIAGCLQEKSGPRVYLWNDAFGTAHSATADEMAHARLGGGVGRCPGFALGGTPPDGRRCQARLDCRGHGQSILIGIPLVTAGLRILSRRASA